MTRTSQTPPLDSSPPGTGPGTNIDSDSPASAIGPASRRWTVHARGPTRTTRLQPRPCHGPRAPRDLAPAKHTEPRRVEHSPPFAATRHGQQARILLHQPGDGVKDCRTHQQSGECIFCILKSCSHILHIAAYYIAYFAYCRQLRTKTSKPAYWCIFICIFICIFCILHIVHIVHIILHILHIDLHIIVHILHIDFNNILCIFCI